MREIPICARTPYGTYKITVVTIAFSYLVARAITVI